MIHLAQSTIGHKQHDDAPESDEPTALKDILPTVAAHGYEGVEIWAPHLLEQDLAKLRGQLAKLRLHVALVSDYHNFTKSVEHAADSLQRAHALIDQTAALAGAAIRVFTGGDRSADASPEQWQRCVDCLQELADHGAEKGVALWLHTHDWNLVDSVDGCLRLIDLVARDNVGLLFKPAYFHPSEFWDLQRLAPHVVGVQATAGKSCSGLADTHLDYRGIMHELARHGRPVWYSFTYLHRGARLQCQQAYAPLAAWRDEVMAWLAASSAPQKTTP